MRCPSLSTRFCYDSDSDNGEDSHSEDNDAGKGREEDKPNDEASKVTGNKETTKADKTYNDGNETDDSDSDSEDTEDDYSDDDDDMLPGYHFKEFTPYETALVRLLTVPSYILQIMQSENEDLLLPELHSLHLYYPCHEKDHATRAATYSELIRTRAQLLQNIQSVKGHQTFQFTLSFCRNKEFKNYTPSTVSAIRAVAESGLPVRIVTESLDGYKWRCPRKDEHLIYPE